MMQNSIKKKKKAKSNWNLIFWVLCPHARDKEFSCTKQKGIFVIIISLKSLHR